MSFQKPTIFFVHGAWHQSGHYESIIKTLEAAGYPAECPTQPTFDRTGSDLKTMTMHDDANFIRARLQQLIETEGREVVTVLHSYGGVVGTQAADGSLSAAVRAAQGKAGGIIRLVYMAAFMLPPNASLGDAFGGKLPPFIDVFDDGSCVMNDPRTLFYSDLDDDTAQKWLGLCAPHVAQSQLTRLTYTAYLHHPVAYIVATQDRALVPELQRKMIEGSQSSGLTIDVYEVAADHSPYLCREAEVADILTKMAERDTIVVANATV